MAAEAAGGKVSSVAGGPAEASEGLAELLDGKVGALLLSIDGETLTQRGRAATPPTVADLRTLIPAEPCYCLYRWAHEREGTSTTSLLFLYICPETRRCARKVLHTEHQGPFITQLQAAGFEFAKSIEGIEAAKLTDAELASQVYGADAAAAAPQARRRHQGGAQGGRKLVRLSTYREGEPREDEMGVLASPSE